MPKLVSSKGLAEFIETGKVQVAPPGKDPSKVEAKEPTPDAPAVETPLAGSVAAPAVPDKDEELSPEEKALPEKAQKEIQRAKRAVNDKHRQMKEAEEAAQEAERFAEQQFNERRLIEKERDEAVARAKDLEAKAAPKAPEIAEPVETDPKYKDAQGNFLWKDFSRDQAKFESDKAVRAERQRLAEEAQKIAQDAQIARLKASADTARKAHPDFDETMAKVRGTEFDLVPQFVLNYIAESENSGEIAYHLAKNPEDSQKIAKLSPIRGIAELGRLEASLLKPSVTTTAPVVTGQPAVTSQAAPPAPITPLTGEGTAGITTDPSKMNFRQLREYERNRAKRH